MAARFDVERLRADSSLHVVAPFIGAELNRQGSTTFIKCPSGEHEETRINHCAVSGDGKICHCFSCGNAYDVFKYVKAYYENVLGKVLSFPELCEVIGDAMGGASFYKEEETQMDNRKQAFPFTKDGLEAIGLSEYGYIRKLYVEDPELCKLIIKENAVLYMEYYKAAGKRSCGVEAVESAVQEMLHTLYEEASKLYFACGGKRVEEMFHL